VIDAILSGGSLILVFGLLLAVRIWTVRGRQRRRTNVIRFPVERVTSDQKSGEIPGAEHGHPTKKRK
jgi:hypothetical protein